MLFLKKDSEVNQFLREEGLILSAFDCMKCNEPCRVATRADKNGGQTFRCKTNKNHEYSIFRYSYFDGCHADIRDIMQFIKAYLEKSSLRQCAVFAGVSYGSTSVEWGQSIRELFMQYVFATCSR